LDLIASSFDSTSKEEETTLEKSSCTCSTFNLNSLKRRPEAGGQEENLDSIRTQELNLDSIRTLEGKRLSFRGERRLV